MKEEFTKIYKRERWGKGQGSGTGSDPLYCRIYLDYLKSIIKPGMVVMDLGCGDWQLYRYFDWSQVTYVGVDVVDHLIQANQEQHPEHCFLCENFNNLEVIEHLLLQGGVPVDLILIKDVIQHWSDDEIIPWIEMIKTLPFGMMVAVNNWKHFRSPYKNELPRDIDNSYRWAPIDMRQFGFTDVAYYPQGKYKQISTFKGKSE